MYMYMYVYMCIQYIHIYVYIYIYIHIIALHCAAHWSNKPMKSGSPHSAAASLPKCVFTLRAKPGSRQQAG